MNKITILFIAVSLALDAFSVSITSGITIKSLRINHALKIAFFFGVFQAVMPVIGWLTGLGLKNFISGIDHWIAFGLLFTIGIKMIYESTKIGSIERKIDPLNIYVLLILSIATSIDALAIGITLSFLKVSIVLPVIIIGIITFILSFFGAYIGNKAGHLFENKAEAAGGVILICIGIKILIQHLSL